MRSYQKEAGEGKCRGATGMLGFDLIEHQLCGHPILTPALLGLPSCGGWAGMETVDCVSYLGACGE